jgi:hypothetical protein
MISAEDAQARLGRHFGLSPQVSKLLTFLLLMECVSAECVATRIGRIEPRLLAHKLRRELEKRNVRITITNVRGYGYCLDNASREIILSLPALTETNPAHRVIHADGVVTTPPIRTQRLRG